MSEKKAVKKIDSLTDIRARVQSIKLRNIALVKNPRVKIEYMAVDKLITPKYNPRTISDHDMEQLKKSLLGFDAVQPAVVNMFKGREGIIVGGNQRVRAAKELGWSEFPCVVVNLPEHKEKELNVRLNRNS